MTPRPDKSKARRQRLTERQVLEVVLRQGGTIPCKLCGFPIELKDVAEAEREHILALALGGTDTLDNMQFSHGECHREQTAKDKAMIAKADRQKLYHETGRSSAKARVQPIAAPVNPWPPKGSQKIAKRNDPWMREWRNRRAAE